MTLADRLRALVDAVPPGGSVTIPRDWLAGELDAVGATPVAAPKRPSEDQWLTAAQVAQRLGTSTRWVYDHATALGGKQLSPRCLRFPEASFRRYVERRGANGKATLRVPVGGADR